MHDHERWLLPEGIDELLPQSAAHFEQLRRRVLDLHASWGYQLIVPPQVEFLDSLLTGLGHDLALQTFKVTDQLSGRMMGVRADMTPQAARIDSHLLGGRGITRLCYTGSVLRTRSDGLGGSRAPYQVGAELFGHRGIGSDLEILQLMLATLRCCGLEQLHIDLGHIGLLRQLARSAQFDAHERDQLYVTLHTKSSGDLSTLLDQRSMPAILRQQLLAMPTLHGGIEVLEQVTELLGSDDPVINEALSSLRQVAMTLSELDDTLSIGIDLADVHGYRYHTGLQFSVYAPGWGQEIARGGRYDGIGRAFGRERPATGFSTDLRSVLQLLPDPEPKACAIFAPVSSDPALHQLIQQLRTQGEQVIHALPDAAHEVDRNQCNRHLIECEKGWQVQPLAD